MKATAAVKIGPISARFTGNVQLSDIDPPNGYTISGEGQGGVAGFAKGGAKVKLADDGADTLLRYEVHAQVGGKLAQLGARLVDATAKQMADQFFDRFSARRGAARLPEPAVRQRHGAVAPPPVRLLRPGPGTRYRRTPHRPRPVSPGRPRPRSGAHSPDHHDADLPRRTRLGRVASRCCRRPIRNPRSASSR